VAELEIKIRDALNESRILVLGTQILLSFQYEWALEQSFAQMARPSQLLDVAALILLLLSFMAIVSPVPYHAIALRDELRPELYRFTTLAIGAGLWPFAVVLGVDVYIVTARVLDRTAGIIAGSSATAIALFFLYGLELIALRARRRGREHHRSKPRGRDKNMSGTGSLQEKINDVLIEARVVLPGAQALLGFQFVGTMTEGFQHLEHASRVVHLASLGLVVFSVILLMTPAAYHRIAERGEPTEHFLKLATGFVIASMIPLGAGMCGDFYVVANNVTRSHSFAIFASVGLLTLLYVIWFGISLYARHRHPVARGRMSDRIPPQ